MWNPTSMINQVMCMEIAAGIQTVSKLPVLMHYVASEGDDLNRTKENRKPMYTPSLFHNQGRLDFTNQNQSAHISDILDWEADITLIDHKIDSFPQENLSISNLTEKYYYANPESDLTEDETMFAEGRSRINLSAGMHLRQTLGWYSVFFYNRDSNLDSALSNVRFKKEYTDLADLIVNSLGDFQGGHLRLSDHSERMFDTKQTMLENSLFKMEGNNLPIIISTCEPSHRMVQHNKKRFILLDEYIVNNFKKEFKELTVQDEIVFGLISNLVMQKSKYFIGTSGSTYTGYIQRKRNQNGLEENWDFFDEPKYEQTGPYSWNGSPLNMMQKNFWREWRESKLNS